MKIISFIVLVLVISSCGSNKLVSDISAIRFGSGGGFTGEIKKYELTLQGELSSIRDQDTTFIKKISQEKAMDIIKSAEAIKDQEVDKPENMYRFIEIDYKKAATKKLIWGLGYEHLPPQVDSLYSKLTSLLN